MDYGHVQRPTNDRVINPRSGKFNVWERMVIEDVRAFAEETSEAHKKQKQAKEQLADYLSTQIEQRRQRNRSEQ